MRRGDTYPNSDGNRYGDTDAYADANDHAKAYADAKG